VAFVIVPAFAFANAGVSLSLGTLGDAFNSSATIAVLAGLVIGKPLGIALGVWLVTRAGARLPEGVTWPSLVGVGMLGGIGFTVSLLIADLAYDADVLINQAKIGILIGSVVAGAGGYLLLRAATRPAVVEA
jgi:NhaA family Na+:H+ antiporter